MLSLNSGPANYVLTDEGDISNYFGVKTINIHIKHSNYFNHTWWIKLSTMLEFQCL